MSTSAEGRKEGGGDSGGVSGDKTVLSKAAAGVAGAGEDDAGEKTKRRTRASPVNAAKVSTSERVVSFIQQQGQQYERVCALCVERTHVSGRSLASS